MAKKNMILHLASFCVVCLEFILCRYVLFPIHGMKEWSFDLFLFCLIVIAISFFVKTSLIPIFSSLSYIVGFVIGLIFQTDGIEPAGGKTNNLCIIWTTVIICAVISSVLGELVKKKFHYK